MSKKNKKSTEDYIPPKNLTPQHKCYWDENYTGENSEDKEFYAFSKTMHRGTTARIDACGWYPKETLAILVISSAAERRTFAAEISTNTWTRLDGKKMRVEVKPK